MFWNIFSGARKYKVDKTIDPFNRVSMLEMFSLTRVKSTVNLYYRLGRSRYRNIIRWRTTLDASTNLYNTSVQGNTVNNMFVPFRNYLFFDYQACFFYKLFENRYNLVNWNKISRKKQYIYKSRFILIHFYRFNLTILKI